MEDQKISAEQLIKIHNSLYEIPRIFRADMRVPARIFINERMVSEVTRDRSLWQIVNVATLPGIQKAAFAMPDIHEGYGFPIGGVAGMALNESGVISPGGIGYDINCGVRLLGLTLTAQEIEPYLEDLATALFHAVPSGVGRGGKIKLSEGDLKKVLQHGAQRMVELGFGNESDLEHCEEQGFLKQADADLVSDKAKIRGHDQLGTLGSGNHFLEIQRVADIYDEKIAHVFGLKQDMVTVMIHCGSRGLGHQTCTDYVRLMIPKLLNWGIELPDAELACAPFHSQEGQDYFAAMCASANFAWANRHMIGHQVRQVCQKIMGPSIHVNTIYDVSHNIGKQEKHAVNGTTKELLVHRKGATRAFPAGRPEVPAAYQQVGHPVLIPGTMGTASYVLVGTQRSMEEAFGSCCHGAGRRMSRIQAKKTVRGSTLREQLEAQGIIIRCDSDPGLAEQAPIAYKDINNVVEVVEQAGLAKKVARVVPLAVIKGG
ncbi:MAG: RtcB family protein [Candidatus Babeliaceae bacterium]